MQIGDLNSVALFLDLDGTLIDIAPTPVGVTIPGCLAPVLERVTHRLGGALAIITGRPMADVDSFLAPLAPLAAGVHGAEMRLAAGGEIETRAEPIDIAVVEAVTRLAEEHPLITIETKRTSIAVHYRQSPFAEGQLEEGLTRILAWGRDHLVLARGRKVFEVLPRNISKGGALRTFMELPSFRGRRPIMIGDDISDQSAFGAAIQLGGAGLKVAGEQFSPTESHFKEPARVRAWLTTLVQGGAR